MNRAVSVSLVAMAHCLEGASAWGLDGPTPRRAILRDGMLLPLIGAANPAGATEAEAAPRTPPSSAPLVQWGRPKDNQSKRLDDT